MQIRIKKEDWDALRFHWINEENPSEIEVYRFTHALFGLNQSPFLLGGTLEQHLSSQEKQLPTEVAEIKDGLYVDDLLTGGYIGVTFPCTSTEVVTKQTVLREIAPIYDRISFASQRVWKDDLS